MKSPIELTEKAIADSNAVTTALNRYEAAANRAAAAANALAEAINRRAPSIDDVSATFNAANKELVEVLGAYSQLCLRLAQEAASERPMDH